MFILFKGILGKILLDVDWGISLVLSRQQGYMSIRRSLGQFLKVI